MSQKSTQNLVLFIVIIVCAAGVVFCSGCSSVKRIDQPQAMQAKARPSTPLPGPARVVDVDLPSDAGLTSAVVKSLQGHSDAARRYYSLYRAYWQACDGNKLDWKQRSDLDIDFKRAKKLAELKPGEYPEFAAIVTAHLTPLASNGVLTTEWLAECKTRFGQLASACVEAAK